LFYIIVNVSVFGQSAQKLVDDSTIEVNSNAKKRNVSAVSTQSNSMNFVLWFMGTKQDQTVQYLKSSSAKNRL
jgi:hypothetical protein